MSITHITEFHAASGQQSTLEPLLIEGRNRMRAAEGCESFDLYSDQDDELSFTFIQSWTSSEAHDAAFGERIVATGHLEKVLAGLGRPLVQRTYIVVH
ncbi:MAG TPA: antibiotic biosynthesis monooxygenase [Acidimicrobiales bacterium]|nr:antibiotic biosynthesis monooxygenase [Acidimicrobiales bacterium]